MTNTSRRYGEGSIYEQAPGRWVGIVELDPHPDGRRHRKWIRGASRPAVVKKVRAVHDARARGEITDERITTGDWLEHWATNVAPRSVSPRTAEGYAWVIGKRIVPYIGKVRLAQLKPAHVERMMTALEREGLSPRSVAIARAVLRRGLTIAERQHLVIRNAAALTDAPRRSKTKISDALDVDQAAAVIAAARGDRLEAIAVLVLAVGLRQGEVLRLRWPDIDLTKATLRVQSAKTDAGVRKIPLPAFVVTALRDHRARQREDRIRSDVWGDPDLVFASTVGTTIDPRNLLRWWHELTIRAGVGRRRFHATRHTAATLMLNNGVPLETVSAILGHAGLAITADVYAKVGQAMQRDAADTMDRVLGQ